MFHRRSFLAALLAGFTVLVLGVAPSPAGAQAHLTPSPTSVDFGTVIQGGAHSTRNVSLVNVGSNSASVQQVSVPTGYAVVSQPFFPIPGNFGSGTLTLRLFSSNSVGTYNGTVQVQYIDDVTGLIGLTGIGVTGKVCGSPTVSITGPASGSTVSPNGSGNVILSASASDANHSISRVDFFVDGALVASDFSAPWAYAWPARNGSHQVSAVAVNDCNVSASSSAVSFTVNCGLPSVSFTSPANGSTVSPNGSGNVILSATASHSTGISQVRFYIDGSLVATDQTAPYQYAWPASTGAHQGFARAFSVCGGAGAGSNRSNFTVVP